MGKHNSKEEELALLLSKVCPHSYPGRPLEENLLFEMCRTLKSNYCLGYNDTGYDEKYDGFESERVIRELATLISSQQIADFLYRNKEKLNEYCDFNGEFYTFYGREKRFSLNSRWNEIRKLIDEFLTKFEDSGKAVLSAILDLNKQGRLFKNYYEALALATRKGFKKGVNGRGFITLLSELQLSRIIDHDLRNLKVPEELMPLVADVLDEVL